VQGYALFNNYPNPFNPSTNIKFSIPERSRVKIRVFNSLGEEIITLLNNTLERGEHSIVWNGKDKNNKTVPSSVSFITMEAKNFRKTIKSVLIK
jgi:flagellar hook assembly protein FlgD